MDNNILNDINKLLVINENKNKKYCGDCSECCKGWLSANIEGKEITPKHPCEHIVDNKCSNYENRPKSPCKIFTCGWLSNPDSDLLPDWMRPDKSKFIFTKSVGIYENLIPIFLVGDEIPKKSLNWTKKFTEENELDFGIIKRIGETYKCKILYPTNDDDGILSMLRKGIVDD